MEEQKQPVEQTKPSAELHPNEWFQKDPEPAVPAETSKLAWRSFRSHQAVAIVAIVVLLSGGLVFAKVASHDKRPGLKSPQQQQIASDQTDSGNLVEAPIIQTSKKSSTNSKSTPTSTSSTSSDPVAPGSVSPGSSSGQGSTTSTAKTYDVNYTSSCFNPATLTIKKGDTVKFTNNSSKNFWPASDDHPTHSIYPEFDAKQAIAPGSYYVFTFLKTGTWGYHDHLKPACKGTIIVQ